MRRMLVLALALVPTLGAGALAAPPEPGPARPAARERPVDPAVERRARQRAFRQEVSRIHRTALGGMRVPDVRKAGMEEIAGLVRRYGGGHPDLRAETFPVLLEELSRDREDVGLALVVLLARERGDAPDAALMHAAAFHGLPAVRGAALSALRSRAEGPGLGEPAMRVLDAALRGRDDRAAVSGAEIVRALDLLEAAPALVGARWRPARGSSDAARGALGLLIAAPTPGDPGVIFSPPTDSALRTPAAFAAVRQPVHDALVAVTSRAWGRQTAFLGWDDDGWRRWLERELPPLLEQRAAARAASAEMGPATGARAGRRAEGRPAAWASPVRPPVEGLPASTWPPGQWLIPTPRPTPWLPFSDCPPWFGVFGDRVILLR